MPDSLSSLSTFHPVKLYADPSDAPSLPSRISCSSDQLASSDAFMANTEQESTLPSESNTREEILVSVPPADAGAGPTSVNEEVSNVSETVSTTPSSVTPKDSNSTPTSTAETRPANTPARPTLVQLGAQSSTSASHPHKKFNAVNINKKFLEKNSAAAMASTSSASASSKSTSSMSRPQMQNTPSHSRLVTAKLTGSPAPSITTGPGWSRPASTAPSSTGTNSPIGSSPLPTAAVPVSANSVAPQLPHVGKVVQPQPRTAALHTANSQKESAKQSAKSAWANVRTPVAPPVMTSEEFPTAAEVAKAMATRRPKPDDQKAAPEPGSAKHRLEEEADTFRGVHLDPNAHHWDEMEEDNDDFLGGVIEFGDGRQYKVEATDPATSPPSSEQPVSKEDRFIDDFDRSWPKSKPSPTASAPDFTATSPALSSRGTSLHDYSHPQLFNERSNRLEPYSHSSRTGQSAQQNRRGSHNDGSVQLLQKAGNGDAHLRSRSGLGPGFIGDRRDMGSRRDHPSSPRMTRQDWGNHEMSPSTSLQGRDREPSERGRRSDMGPPPVPLHATRRLSQESSRRLPPHLSPNAPLPRRLPSRDRESRFPLPSSPHSSRFGPPSPALSHTSTLVLSPSALSSIGLPGADLDEVTKDLMLSAAARAKARKQQEEAEREAQKERARKKAAELEEKLKAAEAEKSKEAESVNKEEETKTKDQEVVAFLENSISGVDGSKSPLSTGRPSIDSASHSKHIPRRTTSQRGQQQRMTSEGGAASSARRPSFGIGTRAPAPETSLASQSNSWRAKINPLPPTSPRQAQTSSPLSILETTQAAPTTLITPSTASDQVAHIAEGSMTDLEVVDFTNMDKFVGSEKDAKEKVEVVSEVEKVETVTEAKPDVVVPKQRPTASDFFEDGNSTSASKNESVWRRKISASGASEGEPKSKFVGKDETTVRASGSTPSMPSSSHIRIRPHTEASMSALDDVMSRIRGAIDGMQASASSKEVRPQEGPSESEQPPPRHSPTSTTPPKSSSHGERPQPPPPRLQPKAKLEELRESLDTAADPLHIPPSADLTVRLPPVSHHIAPVPKRQQIGFARAPYPVRFELLSFEPPVLGMSKRDFSVNAVLFRQQHTYKGSRVRVALPRARSGPAIVRTVSIGPKFSGVGAFGKSTNADGAASWRRTHPTKPDEKERDGDITEGDKENIGAQGQEPKPLEPQQEEPQPQGKVRQPKMPAGSVVAFMRDQRIDAVEADPKPLVNFIVSSELDESGFEAFSEAETDKGSTQIESQASSRSGSSLPFLGRAKADADTSVTRPSPISVNSKVSEGKSEEESAARGISAPSPNHQTTAPSTPWGKASLSLPMKDSTVRAPDPEHLKAVWSQPANKSDLNPVNSLEGIADDLIPFSIQDVKSEDGETPPPALPTATSRMSLHEVTKAFQKVPTSSSSSSTPSRNHISPPSANSTPATRSPYPYSPMPPNPMRPPHYDHYSPMLSHSPAPTVIYPHQLTSSPVPNRMPVNGHPSMYQGAVWMPTSAPGNPMRPMMSPYAAPMMAYAAPGTPVYAPMGTMPGAPQQPPVGTAPGRGRGVPMVSPAMSHAHAHALPGTPMYAGSPVMMPVPPHQNHAAAYLNVHPQPGGTPGRGQGRTDMPQTSQSQNSQQSHHPQPYNPAASFIRSTW